MIYLLKTCDYLLLAYILQKRKIVDEKKNTLIYFIVKIKRSIMENSMKIILKDKPLDARFPLINHCYKMRKSKNVKDEKGVCGMMLILKT